MITWQLALIKTTNLVPKGPSSYIPGRLRDQPVVQACVPRVGTIRTAPVAASLWSGFEGVKVGLDVGVCDGVLTTRKREEILHGDVIISTSVLIWNAVGDTCFSSLGEKEMEDHLGRANHPGIQSFVGNISAYLVPRRLPDKTSNLSAQISAKEWFSGLPYQVRVRYAVAAISSAPVPESKLLYL
jgi:hypothetical protein